MSATKQMLGGPIPLAAPAGASLTVVGDDKHTSLVIGAGRTSRTGSAQPRDYIRVTLTPVGRYQLLTALLDWRYVEDDLPDENFVVLIAIDHPHAEEPARGLFDAGHWYFQDGRPVEPDRRVYAWAYSPGLPPKKGGRA